MKKRKLKKRNRLYIDSLIKQLPYTLKKRVYGSGYFIFSFSESSVSWFWLKDFPDWKFGIWLNEEDNKRFEIFGQCISMIDKFKPSRSELCEDNITGFAKELYKIKSNHSDWQEYLIEAEEAKNFDNRIRIQNRVYHIAISNFIINWNKEQDKKSDDDFKCLYLKLVDGGSGRSPRYDIKIESYKEFHAKEFEKEYFEMLFDIWQKLNNHVGKFYTPEKIDSVHTDSYVMRDFISEEILCKEEWEQRANDYNWSNKDYSVFIQDKYNYYRSYEISNLKLKVQLHSWFVTNYPDHFTIQCFIDTYEELYSGKYNKQYAEEIINEMFRKPDRVRLWLDKYKESK